VGETMHSSVKMRQPSAPQLYKRFTQVDKLPHSGGIDTKRVGSVLRKQRKDVFLCSRERG